MEERKKERKKEIREDRSLKPAQHRLAQLQGLKVPEEERPSKVLGQVDHVRQG
jgi:hypothetical protein